VNSRWRQRCPLPAALIGAIRALASPSGDAAHTLYHRSGPLHLALIFNIAHVTAMSYANAARKLLDAPTDHDQQDG
jgi:hypothetical protein